MKFVIFSDIHGNFDALLEMFRQVENFDITGFIFCGDIMGYFSHQQEIIHCFQQLKNLYAVIGNHDFNYLASFNDIKQQEKFAQKYGKSYRNKLTEYERSFLERLPKTIELQCMKKRIFITHGALENYLEGRIYPDTSINESLYQQYDIIILGHTHYRMFRKVGKTILLNPGSLGQPRDCKGFSYCILDIELETCIYKSVKIDQIRLLNEMIINKEKKLLIEYIKSKMEEIQ